MAVTAWDYLVAASSLDESPENNAWDYLTHSGGIGTVFGDGISVLIDEGEIDVEVSLEALNIDVLIEVEPESIEIEVEEDIEIEVYDESITGEV
jgi:hypothetical protein